MAYDRYPEDDPRERSRNQDRERSRNQDRERTRDQDRERGRDQNSDRHRDHDRDRGFFRGGRDDRGPSLGHDPHRDERDRPRSARDDDHRARKGIPYDETRDLIASSKVEGTPVYGRDDQRLGTVKALMIDKVRGEVRYAVLSHATGFLGLDEEVVPVRWEELRYDERRQGYRVDFTSDDVAYTLENRRRERIQGRNLDENRRPRR